MTAGLVLLLLAGCSSGTTPKAVDGTVTLAGGGSGYREIDVRLDEGKRIEWSWTSSPGPLHFTVHSHENEGSVNDHVIRHAGSDAGHFTAPADGGYSLLWRNLGETPVELQYGVRVYGDVLRQTP